MLGCMETRTLPLAEEGKRKFDALQAEVHNQPVLARARNLIGSNASLVVSGVAFVGVVAACIVTRLLGRR
jgi:hypothetical protein